MRLKLLEKTIGRTLLGFTCNSSRYPFSATDEFPFLYPKYSIYNHGQK